MTTEPFDSIMDRIDRLEPDTYWNYEAEKKKLKQDIDTIGDVALYEEATRRLLRRIMEKEES